MVSLAESAAFVAYEASSAASALEAWSAEMPVSRLASCAATKASVARQWSHRGEQGGQRAGVRAVVAAAILESTLEEVNGEQGVRCQGAGVRLGGLVMEASRLASSEVSAAAVTAPGERWPPWCLPPVA